MKMRNAEFTWTVSPPFFTHKTVQLVSLACMLIIGASDCLLARFAPSMSASRQRTPQHVLLQVLLPNNEHGFMAAVASL